MAERRKTAFDRYLAEQIDKSPEFAEEYQRAKEEIAEIDQDKKMKIEVKPLEAEQIKLEESCGGWCIHWPNKNVGDSLQGWYTSKEEAEKVFKVCQKLVDDDVARLNAKLR